MNYDDDDLLLNGDFDDFQPIDLTIETEAE